MNKLFSIILLVVGIVLIVYGVAASNSVGSSVSRAVTGSPTDKTLWLMIGGVAAAGLGIMGILRGSKST